MSTGNRLNHKSQIEDDIDDNDKNGTHDRENENKQNAHILAWHLISW